MADRRAPAARAQTARQRARSVKTADFLATLPLLRDLDCDEIARIATHTVQIDAPRGSVLFRRSDPCTGFYVVIYGQVKLALQTPSGQEKIIELIDAGQSFGEAVMFLEKPYMVTAETLADSKLLHVARTAMFSEIDHDPRLARRMLASLSMRLHRLMRDLESYTLQSGMQRIVGYLLTLTDQTGTGSKQVELPAQKNIIASRLNLTHEHFSRMLHDLATAGLIDIDGRRIRITDLEKLRNFSH